jgi:hypothetical protein
VNIFLGLGHSADHFLNTQCQYNIKTILHSSWQKLHRVPNASTTNGIFTYRNWQPMLKMALHAMVPDSKSMEPMVTDDLPIVPDVYQILTNVYPMVVEESSAANAQKIDETN